MIIELSIEHALPDTNVVDLGCSTGTTLIGLNPHLDPSIKFIGIDDSKDMLNKCEIKLKQEDFNRGYELIHSDIHHNPGCKQEEKKAVIQPKEEIKKLNEVSTGNIHDGPVYSAKAE